MRLALASIALLALAGCATPGLHVSSEVVWADVDAEAFPVTPGDIVRVESSAPVAVTMIIGAAEVTQTFTPTNGVIMFRPPLGTTTVKVPGGHVVHDGGPRDPEQSWYDLEDEAIAWAKTPLGTPFPALTTAPRFDPKAASELDAALGEAKISDAHAIRALFALRAIRTLEGLRIYPYAANGDEKLPGSKREIKGREFYEQKPGTDATVSVDGPTVLAFSSRVVRTANDVEAEVKVTEGPRERGSVRSVVHHLAPDDEKQKIGEDEDKPDPTLAPLRKLLVHVPAGKHTYKISVNAPTWIVATSTDPYEELIDAFGGAKHEGPLGEEAARECSNCAIALALTGKDLDASFDAALAAAGPLAKKEALALSAGAPFDRATQLESDAASRDKEAVAQAGKDAASSIDASLREAWARGTLRGTGWQTVDETAPLTWFAAGGGNSKEIGSAITELAPEPWRRTQVIRLMATGDCSKGDPVQLEVNGATLTAQPSAARATWHIVVPAGTAKVRRLDKGPSSGTRVYALDEGGGSLIGAALPLSAPRTLAYPAGSTAPGVELWLKAGASSEAVTITSADGAQKLDVVAHMNNGFAALADDGAKWTRVVTVPLAWNTGAKVTGGANVAVRAVVRGVKEAAAPKSAAAPVEHAGAPNVDAVVAASRKLLAAKTNPDRAAAALERAKLLASFGAERAALDDAELAQSYGQADAVAQVQRAYKPAALKALEVSQPAYGLESDFDPNAARCAAGEGPRAKISALDKELRARPKGAATFDRSLAVQAATLQTSAPEDPRGSTLVTLASSGSRWKLLRDVDGGGGRVARPSDLQRNPLLDADGRLRPHLLGGDPFGKNYVSVASDRPARAVVPEKGHLDVLCTPRKMPNPNETCPLEVTLGETKVPVSLNEDGKGTVDLPKAKGRKGAELNVSLGNGHADWSALIRIVLDKEVANTTKVDGGFVLDTPHIQYRFLLPPGKPIKVKADKIGLLRVDADPEGNDKPEVVANVGGKEIPIPVGGDPKVIPLPAANAPITITSKNGTATVAIAERVESDSRTQEGTEPAAASIVSKVDTTSARMSINDGTWRDTAEKSPPPYGWFLDHLGTFESDTGMNFATIRDGSRSDKQPDTYGFQEIAYRRRIESINLFTEVDGLVRIRNGQPTYGGSGTLYEDWNATRLRITGTVDAYSQNVNDKGEFTLQPRGFVEYSARITPSIYILPRIGYDGWFTSIKSSLKSLKDVDDDVFNPLRFARNNYAFVQALFWWVPFFDEITYVRARGTFDVGNGVFSHADLRPGVLFLAGPIEFNGYADAQYIKATPGARESSGVDFTGSILLLYHAPITAGSFEVRPFAQALVRDDGGYEFSGGLTLLGSAHRGVRDYSSLELSFPEGTAGGVPWRTEGREGP